MSDDVNMDSFIQDTLRSMRRPRDSGFYSDQPPLISTSTKKFTTTSTPDATAIVSTDCDLPAEGIGIYPFAGSYNSDTGVLTIGKGSYEYPLGTNVDVQATSGTGNYAYAVIKQNAGGGLVEFKTEASASTKDPTNRDAADEYVEYSNVLLGEVMTVPDPEGGPDTYTFTQRRTGNLSLIRRIINGSFCLWPETTGGSSL
jgi:hypothetical protein